MKEYKVTRQEEGIKCVKYCLKILPNAGSGFIYKMLRKKNITLNDKKSDGMETLKDGDVIKFYFSDETFDKFSGMQPVSPDKKSTNNTNNSINNLKSSISKDLLSNKSKSNTKAASLIQLDRILYEDENILLYNKPAGLLSQKANNNDISLNEILCEYVSAKDDAKSIQKPSICNRLDRNTSGIVIFGKTYQGLLSMNRLLKDRTIGKYYHCIVKGNVSESILLKGYLIKDEKTNKVSISKTAKDESSYIETEIKPLKQSKELSLLEVHLITGKTHQIRAHLASIGHPILGDMKYGGNRFFEECKRKYHVSSQLLHAYRLEFPEIEDCLKEVRGKQIIAPKSSLFTKVENSI